MLARVVESVYWLSRYLERAENTARIIGVNTNLLLDLPGGIAPGWLPLVDISGNRAEFDKLVRRQGHARRRTRRRRLPHRRQGQPRLDLLVAAVRARERAHAARNPAHRGLGTAQRVLRGIHAGPGHRHQQAHALRIPEAHRGHAADHRRHARRHDEPQRRVHLQPAGPQSRTRRHDQPHRRRALGATAARRDARAASLRDRAVDERAEEPVGLPDVPAAHAHAREAHRRAPVPAARRPVPALLPVLPDAARAFAQRAAAQRGRARRAGRRGALHRTRAAGHARPARPARAHRQPAAAHQQRAQHDRGDLFSVRAT